MPLIILVPLAIMFGLFREMWDLVKQPKYRALFVWIAVTLLAGVIFYHQIEGWSWVDSFYFSVITLSTVGYGDLAPTTDVSKLFTTFYVFFGISIFITFASLLAQDRRDIRVKREDRSNSGQRNDITPEPDQ